jgi:hypothetical protein
MYILASHQADLYRSNAPDMYSEEPGSNFDRDTSLPDRFSSSLSEHRAATTAAFQIVSYSSFILTSNLIPRFIISEVETASLNI